MQGRGSNVILVGPMGSGKTTVGWLLARFIGYGFIDLDELITQKEKKTIEEIFDVKGETAFREIEGRMLAGLEGIRCHVIATGGGTVAHEDNWNRIADMGVVIWLNPPPDEIARRLMVKEQELAKRPLLADVLTIKDPVAKHKMLCERISAIAGNRSQYYKRADFTASDSFSTPYATALQVKNLLKIENVLNTPTDHRFFDRWSIL